jgi:ABC-type spermidine/putrescine transport system permease subunit II
MCEYLTVKITVWLLLLLLLLPIIIIIIIIIINNNNTGFWWEDLMEKDHLEYLDVDGRTILKWNFKRWNWEM